MKLYDHNKLLFGNIQLGLRGTKQLAVKMQPAHKELKCTCQHTSSSQLDSSLRLQLSNYETFSGISRIWRFNDPKSKSFLFNSSVLTLEPISFFVVPIMFYFCYVDR